MSTKAKAKQPQQFPVETRILKTTDGEFEFKVLRITSPEDWKPATEFSERQSLRIRGSDKPFAINLRGLSYKEWEQIEFSYPIPRWDSDEPYPAGGDQEFDDKKDTARQNREVMVLEAATGMKIPGETQEEKISWLTRLGTGESQNLFTRILEYHSAIASGPLEAAYDSAKSQSANGEQAISKFEDWLELSKEGTVFRMQRPFEDYLIEIPLQQIPQERYKEIDRECPDPIPPSRPGKNPTTGKPDPAFPIFAYQDPGYLGRVKAMNRKKRVLLLDAALPFKLPGDTTEEKFNWLGDRLLGDINRLVGHLEDDLLNYRNRFDFFTSNSGHQN